MEYISVSDFSQKHGLPERTVRNWCASGKIPGAFLTGKTWRLPADAELPVRGTGKKKPSPLLKRLREEKEGRISGGIYHRTQIDLTYNSNHIEGSRLTHEQTQYIFETNTIGISEEAINVDDIVETANHFRCIDYIIDHAEDRLSESLIKELHRLLKTGTSDSRKDWFNVGDYKRLPNEVGGATKPARPNKSMQRWQPCSSPITPRRRNRWKTSSTSTASSSAFIPSRTATAASADW